MKKKMWIVKREVLAETIEQAMKVKNGRIYEVTEADEKYQPEDKPKKVGF